MTCIIGMEYEGKVYIGGDSASLNGWDVQALDYQKVFLKQNSFLIGVAGQPRIHDIIRYQVAVREQDDGETDEHYLVSGFVVAVRETLKANGFLTSDEGRETNGLSALLLGFHGKLYYVGGDFEVSRFREGITAIGIGADFAIGSLYTQRKTACAMDKGADPAETMLMRALDVAGVFSASVRPPYYVRSI